YRLPCPVKRRLARSGTLEPVVISPDGRKLALIVRTTTTPEIWIRDLDSTLPRMLPGTENVVSLFWSSDSQWIGFTANGGGTVQKISVAGGRPIKLAELPQFTASGGSWNQFGDIILGSVTGAIVRIPDHGGEPSSASTKDPQKNEFGHRWPQFLPDGRHYLFFISGTNEISVGSLDQPDHSTITRAESRATYAEPGYLLFVREGSLTKMPFDLKTFKPTGAPTIVMDVVRTVTGSGAARFSTSTNNILAYVAPNGSGTDRLVWFNRAGQPGTTVGDPGSYRNPRLSPDGRRLLVEKVSERVGDGTSDLWLYDLSRGGTVPSSRFTIAPLRGYQGDWGRDGSRIAFAVAKPGPATIYQKLTNGVGTEEPLVKSDVGAGPNDWSPDGGLLYHAGIGQPPTSLMLVGRNGKPHPIVSSKFVDVDGRFSPDGKWLA